MKDTLPDKVIEQEFEEHTAFEYCIMFADLIILSLESFDEKKGDRK